MMRIEKRFLENSKGAIMIYCLLESDTRRGIMRLIEPWENIEINVLAEDRIMQHFDLNIHLIYVLACLLYTSPSPRDA